MSRRRVLPAVLMVTLPVTAVAASGSEIEDGKRLYRVHCQGCHGESGHGDGPMEKQMEITIPDLTTLADRYGGEFPAEKVNQIIDGLYESPTHGTRAMPVWGFTFQSSGRDTDQEDEVRQIVESLTRYLETLQPVSATGPESDEAQDRP